MQAKYSAPDGQHTFPRLLMHHAATRGQAPAMREKDLGVNQRAILTTCQR